ncbi:MAG: tyrosine-type recombinase/integrase [Acidimicrobiales bacterium]
MPRRPTGKRSARADGRITVRGKAANGEGSVYYAGDGRWRATYWIVGENRPRTVSAKTREKVIARRAERLAEIAATTRLPARFNRATTVTELAHWWLHTIQRHQVRPSTFAKAEDRVRRIAASLGEIPVSGLQTEQVATWQSDLLAELAPKTVGHHRQTLAQILDQAVEVGLVTTNVARRVKPPRVLKGSGRALTVAEVQRLVAATGEDRLGAAVALLFFQGWRVSKALGLAWSDVDLDQATAKVRRACVYVDHQGPALSATKTDGALGLHQLVPTVVELLRDRRAIQAAERLAAGPMWQQPTFEGKPIDLVFTTRTGGLVLRQAVTKAVATAAARAGIDPTRLGTHAGRRSVVPALYADAGESIEEITRFVGHASPATTAADVRDLGRRPTAFARRAALLLDPAASSGEPGARS